MRPAPLFVAAFAAIAIGASGPTRSAVAADQAPGGGPGRGAAADWATPAERDDDRTTPRYDATMKYLRRLQAAAPKQVRIESFGRSPEGRDLVAVVVSGDGRFEPAALHRAGRPIVLVQNAIHAGEMDGKDACLALLRDLVITRERAALPGKAVLVVIPIYNVDGHERFGPDNRINQNGPAETGWRTQAANLNLNRDYMKADAPETRAFLRLWNRWLPDLFIDTHVTDGADYQYDTTIQAEAGPDVAPGLAAYMRGTLVPALLDMVGRTGHVIGPYIALKNETDPSQGMLIAQAAPRYSTGYAIVQNRLGILVETHMLKDYRTRVTGTYELLRAALEVVNRDAATLVRLIREADAATIAAGRRSGPRAPIPLRLEPESDTEPFVLRGYRFERHASPIAATEIIRYSHEPIELTIPRPRGLVVRLAVNPPAAYIVPAAWSGVIEVLEAHGLALLRTTAAWEGEVGTYRCDEARWLDHPFEGRQVLFNPGEGRPGSTTPGVRCRSMRQRLSFPAGSVVVPLDQRAAHVAVHWLEPEAPDSALAWGFFNAIFERKEYGEPYVVEPLARSMLEADVDLKREFEQRLADDPNFAASPEARLEFFYRRSRFEDPRLGLYPVGRLDSLDGVPLPRRAP